MSAPDPLLPRLQDKRARVGVLLGGMSTEREISLKSGHAVHAALLARGWDAVEIDVGPDLPARLIAAGVEVAWIALHGAFGEDGCVQGLLEVMRIPYTGSSVRASAIAMDKVATKRMLADAGVRLVPDRIWRAGEPLPEDLQLPVVAKTPRGGSSIGVAICRDPAALEAGVLQCAELDPEVLIEDMIQGEEITVAVLDGVALPVVAIQPVEGFFDFTAKYTKGRTRYVVPAPIPEAVAQDASEQARRAYARLGLNGVARADFIVDSAGFSWFLEINTIPGMTATSLSPMAAGAVGMTFEELVERLLLGARLHEARADQREAAPSRG